MAPSPIPKYTVGTVLWMSRELFAQIYEGLAGAITPLHLKIMLQRTLRFAIPCLAPPMILALVLVGYYPRQRRTSSNA